MSMKPAPATHEEQIADWCVHFTGLMQQRCAAGVIYTEVKGDGPRWPCFQRDGVASACPHTRYPTPEEVAAQVAESDAALARFLADLAADRCPHCQTPITTYSQVGRCVYGAPCGHRLYQGRVPRKAAP